MGAIIEDPLSVSEAKNSFVFQHSEIRDRQDTNPRPAELPWEIFCARFSEPDCTRGDLNLVDYQALDSADPEQKKRRAAEKDGPAWLPVTFKPDGKRTNEDVQAITAFVGECRGSECESGYTGDQKYFAGHE